MPRPRLFGPLLRYELLTSARRVRYYALRGGYVAALGFILWIAYHMALGSADGRGTQQAIRANASVASNFAAAFGYAQLAAALLLVPALLAPALTAEKERRTIDYLLTTDLTDRELILGKFAARLLVASLPVVAGIGLLGICQVFGGLDAGEILTLTIVTLTAMVSVGALAMLASVRIARTRDALLAAYLLTALALGLPHVVSTSTQYWIALKHPSGGSATAPIPAWLVAARDGSEGWRWTEPFYLIHERGAGRVWKGPTEDLRFFAGVHLGAGALMLLVAWLTVRGRRRAELAGAGGASARWWRRRIFRTGWRMPLGWLPAMVWKEYFFARAMAFWPTLLAGLCSFAWLFACVVQVVNGNDASLTASMESAWRVGVVAFGLWTTLATAIRAATAVPTEIAQDTWAFLLATPLRPGQIVFGKAVGALRPLTMYAGFLLLGGAAAWIGSVEVSLPLVAALTTTAGLCVFFAGAGLWIGAAAQRTGPALLGTLGVFAIVNGVGQLAALLTSAFLAMAFQMSAPGFEHAAEIWTMSFPATMLSAASGIGIQKLGWSAAEVTVGACWVAAHFLLGLTLLAIMVRQFPTLVGRGEGPRRPEGVARP